MVTLHLRFVQNVLPVLVLAAGLGSPWTFAAPQDRGELLYNTHCVGCHNSQMHWRDKRQVVDWPSLRAQVRLWQATGLLAWDESDIDQVTRYLNDTYYRYPVPSAPRLTGRAFMDRRLAQR